jgi:2-oxoisovalerate dehydrogenase E1 component alpha subunit
VTAEQDCITEFEKKLEAHGLLTRAEMDQIRARWTEQIAALARQVRDEPLPEASTIWKHVYAEDR